MDYSTKRRINRSMLYRQITCLQSHHRSSDLGIESSAFCPQTCIVFKLIIWVLLNHSNYGWNPAKTSPGMMDETHL